MSGRAAQQQARGAGHQAPGRVVVRSGQEHREQAARVASELGLPLVEEPAAGQLALVLDARGWALVDPAESAAGPVRCDLTRGETGRRLREMLRRGPAQGDRLARALGLGRGRPLPRVLDATAGLGRESVLAAALGCPVVSCERSPAVALLLRDGLARAATVQDLAPVVARIEVRTADARDVLASLAEEERPDVVLVDPMFPERRKAARSKQAMQTLQRLLGPEPDVADLLDAALAAARRRVVVKRPTHAPPPDGRRPDILVPGRASRFDVYLVR